jgi:FKBP-type peptidyl-prolyl cis-trans isomerase FklB
VKTFTIALLIAVTLSAAWVVAQETLPVGPGAANQAAEPATPPTDARHYSYAIGLDLGASFRGDKLAIDVESLVKGIQDGLKDADPQFSPELCQVALERLNGQRLEALKQRNEEFLVVNAKAQGVQTTPSGLQYKVLESGDGPTPTAKDVVKVHYRGQLIDGMVFDESYGGEPATLALSGPNGVIPGWVEALQQMKVGDKWQLVIPSALAYREQGAGDVIPPNATLIFEVELLGIEGK